MRRAQIRDGRDYGSYLQQHAEYRERCGMALDPDDRVQGFEDDLQHDLEQERAGVKPSLPMPAPLPGAHTNFDGVAAAHDHAA